MELKLHEPLAGRTSFGVGGTAQLYGVLNERSIKVALDVFMRRLQVPVCILGSGTNVLFSDRPFEGLVLQLRQTAASEGVTIIDEHDGLVLLSADGSVLWDDLVSFAVSRGCGGIEYLSGIPGTVGAAPVQNISAYGQQVADVITEVWAIDLWPGSMALMDNAACRFGYRSSVFNQPGSLDRSCIIKVLLKLTKADQPLLEAIRKETLDVRREKGTLLGQYRCAGSFFKNPIIGHRRVPAAQLIERAGFGKGHRFSPRVGLSPHHALCIVNYGGATAEEITDFTRDIQEKVWARHAVFLEPEVRLINFDPYPLMHPRP